MQKPISNFSSKYCQTVEKEKRKRKTLHINPLLISTLDVGELDMNLKLKN